MATVYKKHDRKPIPPGAKIETRTERRKGPDGKEVEVVRRFARYEGGRGKWFRHELADDGTHMLVERKCWYIDYRGADGKTHTVKGFKDKGATEQEARRLESEAERQRAGLQTYDAAAGRTPLAEALAAWLADLKRRGKSRGYIYNMKLHLNKMADGCGWRTIGSIRSDTLQTWLSDLKCKDLSGRTLNQYLQSARAFVNWCCQQDPPWLPGNPLRNIQPADETVKRRVKRALTLDELDRLRRASGKRWVVYLTAALTGLRKSEFARLLWGDVRLDAEHPHIQLRAEATKAKRDDVIPINPELAEALTAIRPANAHPTDRVFQRVPRHTTFKRDVTERADIPWRDEQGRLASFHCLRKTFGTYLALTDVPLRVAMDMMRITDAKLLTGIYQDAKLFNTSAAAAKLPRLVRTEDLDDVSESAAG